MSSYFRGRMVRLLLLLLLLLEPIHGEQRVRQNIGVIYEQLPGQIITGHDQHQIILAVPYHIPETPRPKPPIYDIIQSLQAPTIGPSDSPNAKLLQQALDLDKLITNIDINIRITMDNIRHFLSDPINNRSKRAILAFLGELFKSIFGLATTKDIDAIMNTILDLDRKIGTLADVNVRMAQGLHDVTQQHQAFLDTYVNQEDVVQQALLNITDSIDLWSDDFSTTLTSMQDEQDRHAAQSAIISAQTVVLLTRLAYQQGLAKVENSLRLLSTGILAPDMIRPTELALKLDLLNTHLKITNPGSEVTIINTAYYYSQPVALYTYSKTHLYIHLNIIISSTESAFNLFQIITIDVPINTENTNSTGTTSLISTLSFLAVNDAETLYLEMTAADLLTCEGQIMKVCSRTIPRIRSDNPTCHIAAFRNDQAEISRLCTFQIQPFKPLQTLAIAIDKNKYLVSTDQENYHVICQHKTPSTKKATAYAVVGVPCHCHLQFGGLYLPNTEIPCNNSRSTHFVMHTANMPIISALTDSEVDISPSSLHNTPIHIPSLHTEELLKALIPSRTLPKDVTMDLIPFTELILRDAKQAAKVLNRPLRTIPAMDNVASFFNHSVWNYIIPVLTIINSMVMVVIIFKTLGRQAIFTALPTVSARPFNVTWKHLIKINNNNIKPTQIVHIDQYVDAENIITLMIIAMVAYLVFKIIKSLKTKCTRHFGLNHSSRKTNPTITLKIYNDHTNHTIPLLSIPHEMDVIKPSITPPMPMIRTHSCPHPRINMAWTDPITLEINGRQKVFCLPHQVLLPLAARFSLIPALQDPTTTVALVLKTADITVSLPTTTNDLMTDLDNSEGDQYQPLVIDPKDMTTVELMMALRKNRIQMGNEN